MDEILRFLVNYEVWIYAALGLGAVFFLRQVLKTLQEWRRAVFGMEREGARIKFNTELTGLFTLIALAGVELVVVSFIAPGRPQAPFLATPTIDFLATATVTLPAGTKPAVTPTGLAQTAAPAAEGCTPGVAEWIFPKNGGQVSGTVVLKGTVNVPSLGFYKYEYAGVGSTNWLTIAAGNTKVVNGELGSWNTGQLVPGDYRLRLVVADNQNQQLPACVITVRVTAP